MNKVLIKKIKEKNGLTFEQAKNIVKDVFDGILEEVENTGKFTIYNFGTFKKKEKEAREQKINDKVYNVSARTTIGFKPSKTVVKIK